MKMILLPAGKATGEHVGKKEQWLGYLVGPIGALLPELFSVNVRYTGSGIGYNLAAIVGAAFVPSVATWLSSHWGVGSVGLCLGVMALCCLVAILTCHETKDVDYMQ